MSDGVSSLIRESDGGRGSFIFPAIRGSVLVNSSDRFPDRLTGGLHAAATAPLAHRQTHRGREATTAAGATLQGVADATRLGVKGTGRGGRGMAGANREEAEEQATHSV